MLVVIDAQRAFVDPPDLVLGRVGGTDRPRAGCTTLLTEDLQDGRRFDGLVVRNPFPAPDSN